MFPKYILIMYFYMHETYIYVSYELLCELVESGM